MKLYHFTCGHGAQYIQEDGEIRPHLHPYLGESLAWFTPIARPKPREIGLQRNRLQCDRMAHRFEVETDEATHWMEVRQEFGEWEVRQLELSPGARPAFWYVTRVPVPIKIDSSRSVTA